MPKSHRFSMNQPNRPAIEIILYILNVISCFKCNFAHGINMFLFYFIYVFLRKNATRLKWDKSMQRAPITRSKCDRLDMFYLLSRLIRSSVERNISKSRWNLQVLIIYYISIHWSAFHWRLFNRNLNNNKKNGEHGPSENWMWQVLNKWIEGKIALLLISRFSWYDVRWCSFANSQWKRKTMVWCNSWSSKVKSNWFSYINYFV